MSVTASTVLASIEAIPETAENFRARREAIRDVKALIEQEQS
jgi:predicted XRE-type DNA-binding protein